MIGSAALKMSRFVRDKRGVLHAGLIEIAYSFNPICEGKDLEFLFPTTEYAGKIGSDSRSGI